MRQSLVLSVFLCLASALAGLAPLSARAGDDECGIVGYDKANPKAYFYRNDTESANFSGCKALCSAQSICESFAISDDSCLLYNTTVSDNVRLDNDSPFAFYAVSCTDGAVHKAAAVSSSAAVSPTATSGATGVPSAAAATIASATSGISSTRTGTAAVSATSAASGAAANRAASLLLPFGMLLHQLLIL